MKNLTANFETELDQLLKQYFAEEDLNQMNFKSSPQKEDNNNVSEKINDFYRSQLDINPDSFNERIKIDRTITFSAKQLIPDKFCEFMLDLGRLCISNGKLNLANEIFKKTIKNSDNNFYKAESMLELADVFSRRADWPGCLRTVAEAETMYREIKDSSGIAKCYNLKGVVYGEQGEMEKAKSSFQKSLSHLNIEKDVELAANLNTNLGIIDNIQENKDDAKNYFKNALLFYKKLGNHRRMGEIHYNIGMSEFESGEFDAASDSFDEGIEIAKNGRFMSILCLLYLVKSQLLIEQDDINAASDFVNKAFEMSHNVDDKLTSADIYKVKGIIERRRKNYKLSETYLLNSLRINTSLKNETNIAETSLELADLYKETDSPESKNSYLKIALNYYKKIKALQKVEEIESQLGMAAA